MGWGSWYAYGKDGESGVTEGMIKAQADLLVSTGLADVGYKLVWPDCDFLSISSLVSSAQHSYPHGTTVTNTG